MTYALGCCQPFLNPRRVSLLCLLLALMLAGLLTGVPFRFVSTPPFLALTSQAHATETAGATSKGQKWTCPMHPHYIADAFGTCPICGMDLVKLQTEPADETKATSMGKTIITIPAETIQTMGVRVETAEVSTFGQRIRSFGIVKENERLQTELSARVEGWIEKLNITAVGDEVKDGDILFEMFSPELIVSQRDFLVALGQTAKAQGSIRRRLLSFGVQEKALELIAKEKEVQQNLPFFASQNGTVAVLNVTPGSYVKRGMTIAKIQDYSVVWVMVNVSEKDMSFIKKGTGATIYFPNMPGKSLTTVVDYIYPEIDEKTRTGQVRLVLDNKVGSLRPGTYADVVFETEISERLSVPSEAVLRDETGNFVVVSLGQGRFQPRPVELGIVTKGRAEIVSGLKSGEGVVVSAQFLIDSESTLRESFRKLERLQLPLTELKLSKLDLAKFDHMVDAALYMHEALTDGYNVEGKFLEPAISIRQLLWPDYKDTRLAPVLQDAEAALKAAKEAKTKSEIRNALNQLINALEPYLLEGAPAHYKERGLQYYQITGDQRKWLQMKGAPLNPYAALDMKKSAGETSEGATKTEPEFKEIAWPEIMATKMGTDEKSELKDKGAAKPDETLRGSGHVH